MNFRLIGLLGLFLCTSCSVRNLSYLSDLNGQAVYTEAVTNSTEPRFQADDLLSISVISLNPESNSLFNRGEMPTSGVNYNYNGNNHTPNVYKEGYLVDSEGFIDFPVLGKIKLGGLSKAEAKAQITKQLELIIKDPIVNIRYLNYKITVVGEVNKPATFTVPSEKINVLEALGMAGDMTQYGKRESVLLIREVAGVRTVTRLDLTNSEILNSPYFFLQQNDIIYVEPDKMKAVQASTNVRSIAITTSALTLLIVAIARFF